MASFGTFSFAQTAHPAHLSLAVSLVVAVLTALVLPLCGVWPGPVSGVMVLMTAVLAQWPVRGLARVFPALPRQSVPARRQAGEAGAIGAVRRSPVWRTPA